nr:FCD domain-containing protein [uncultured Cellulosilyticum sp.]
MDTKMSSREIAVRYILDKIKQKEFKEGDKLTNERALSEELGISRVSLREAICTLGAMGILETRQGGGTYISGYKPQIIGKIIQTYGLFDRSLIEEVFEARSLIEADAARLAARNRTKEDLLHLEKALIHHEMTLVLYEQKKVDAKEMMKCDGEVHLGIAASSHNNFMVQMIESMRHVTETQDYFSEENTVNHNHFKESAIMHRKVFEAIERQEADEAYRLMAQHINEVRLAIK